MKHCLAEVAALFLVSAVALTSTGCSTAPKVEDRPTFIAEARAATAWFERHVIGLRRQIDHSAGYIVFPGVGQWGMLITGGKFGRGMLNGPNDAQIGWAAVNTGSLGLQAGVQGFKMLIVFEDDATLEKFRKHALSGSVSGVVLVGEAGGSGSASFRNGVAVYQGANTGLMAGVNIGLDYLRYQSLDG